MKSQISNLKSQNDNAKLKINKNNKIVTLTLHFALCTLHSRRRRVGFTIIEVLIAVTVIFIIIGMAFASYASLNQRQKLISAGQTLKNIIRDAQSRAYTNELDCSVCDCRVATTGALKGWYVDFATREIYGECKSIAGPVITFSPRPFNLSSEITITPHITPPARVMFRGSPPSSDKNATICITQSNLAGFGFYVVRTTSAGNISDEIVPACP